MPQKKFSFGITTGKGYVDLARFDPRKNGSIYLTPYPPFWGDTGFHASFHPNGTYFKTYKPLNTVFAGGNASSLVNDIRNHLRGSMRDLNLQEEPGIIFMLNFDNPFQHIRLQGKKITMDGLSMMNCMGVAEVDNVKRSFHSIKHLKTPSIRLALIHGMNTGTTSLVFDSLNQNKNKEAVRITKGLTSTFNLCDFTNLRQIPFVSPFIAPMTDIIEGSREYLPRTEGLPNLSDLKPLLKLDIQ